MRLHETATTEDILRQIVIYQNKYEIFTSNFMCFVIDGAPRMIGIKSGFVEKWMNNLVVKFNFFFVCKKPLYEKQEE